MTHGAELVLRYAVGTDVGRRREANEDSAFASPRLLVVADGMGGHVHGEVASTATVGAAVDFDAWLGSPESAGVDPLAAVAGAITDAVHRLSELVADDEDLRGMGTTCTAFLWHGNGFAVAHIGDSRAYLLRDGELSQVTRDHTLVQALVDEGRLRPEQVENHPRRSVLVRALQTGGATDQEPDVFSLDARIGDRFLLCSDGLSDVVPASAIGPALAESEQPAVAVASLVKLANAAGGPDNITCVVADVLESAPAGVLGEPVVVGAASGAPGSRSAQRPGWLPAWAARLFSG